LVICSTASLPAQEILSLDEIAEAAEEWAQENLDEDLLAALNSNDRERARIFFERLQKELGGEYVLDLPALKETAQALVPLLESREETAPYALWLKTRLDYFDVAEELRPPPVKPQPEQPPERPANPAADKQREAWVRKTRQRPWPAKATEYVPQLKPIFAAERVPSELVWLAEVESSFDPRARSPVGAAGLFQLMPATAKRFGLSTLPSDQRLHPRESARAAGKYLNFLHGKFKDWRLAVAAYNCGEGTVQRLLARRKARTFDEIAPFLPAETQL
jgi:membrane-bound lytic murein transglycosylase D